MSETKIYNHGRFEMAGGILPNTFTAYRTYGHHKNPCIVFPTCYGGRLEDQLYLIGEGKALDPTKYFIVTFGLFSGGESSSPSNTKPPFNGPFFPAVTYEDNVRAQYEVLTKEFGITTIFAVIGFSMGGQLAYYWPVMYSTVVERFICICGSAQTSVHNKCFLEGPKAALVASKDFQGGHYTAPPEHGLRAFGRVYAGWAYSQAWYRRRAYLEMGGQYNCLQNFLRGAWEWPFSDKWDANDLLTLLNTWQMGDVAAIGTSSVAEEPPQTPDSSSTPEKKPFNAAYSSHGDFIRILQSISAKGLIMPSKTDLYFPPEDNKLEVEIMQGNNIDARLRIIDSDAGHQAGGGAFEVENRFINQEITKFFEGK
ncbi:homoserine acetyltransferase [Panus rudis PR-1116 ss-1]|nr:homoserine acetyltransferase [Panus rudis PR-1116 ss-1]